MVNSRAANRRIDEKIWNTVCYNSVADFRPTRAHSPVPNAANEIVLTLVKTRGIHALVPAALDKSASYKFNTVWNYWDART